MFPARPAVRPPKSDVDTISLEHRPYDFILVCGIRADRSDTCSRNSDSAFCITPSSQIASKDTPAMISKQNTFSVVGASIRRGNHRLTRSKYCFHCFAVKIWFGDSTPVFFPITSTPERWETARPQSGGSARLRGNGEPHFARRARSVSSGSDAVRYYPVTRSFAVIRTVF